MDAMTDRITELERKVEEARADASYRIDSWTVRDTSDPHLMESVEQEEGLARLIAAAEALGRAKAVREAVEVVEEQYANEDNYRRGMDVESAFMCALDALRALDPKGTP